MNTSNSLRTTRESRDPIFSLLRELRIRGFSKQTIKAYLYYNKESLGFANN